MSSSLRHETAGDPDALEVQGTAGCLGLLYRRRSDGLTLPFRCDGWSCPECAPVKGRRVARAVRLAALKMGLAHLLTLTLPGRGNPLRGDPVGSRRAVGPMWNALRTYLRKHGYLERYLAVPEWQKDGTCHLHVGTDSEVPWKVLSRAWARLGGGFVWVSPKRTMRDPEDVARELAKYLTKSAAHPESWQTAWTCKEEGGFRRRPWHRYWPSRSVGRAITRHLEGARLEDAMDPPRDGETWELVRFIEGEDTRDLPAFHARADPTISGCPGHLETGRTCCHGTPGLTTCRCGGPAEVRPWEFVSFSDSMEDPPHHGPEMTSWRPSARDPDPPQGRGASGVGPGRRARQSDRREEATLEGWDPD